MTTDVRKWNRVDRLIGRSAATYIHVAYYENDGTPSGTDEGQARYDNGGEGRQSTKDVSHDGHQSRKIDAWLEEMKARRKRRRSRKKR
jgi:hypothetical protein